MNNSFSCIKERIRNKVADSLLCNKTYYVIYFGCIILGALIGFLTGKDLTVSYELDINNRISLILYEKAGIFYVFKEDLLLFFILYFVCFVGISVKWVAILNFLICGIISFRIVRLATCLIAMGGACNVFGAILFYLIYYLVFLLLYSFVAVKCLYYSKSCSCSLKLGNRLQLITPSYLFAVGFCFVYSVLISILLSIFSI